MPPQQGDDEEEEAAAVAAPSPGSPVGRDGGDGSDDVAVRVVHRHGQQRKRKEGDGVHTRVVASPPMAVGVGVEEQAAVAEAAVAEAELRATREMAHYCFGG
jgi:hypothetical protein